MPTTFQPGDTLGRYRVERPLGSGAMGEVYLARDPQIDRLLAVKTLRLAGVRDEELGERRQRLLREARTAGRLIHPHIVTLFDAGEQDGLLFLAFEYVPGSDLSVRLRSGPLPVGEALRIARETCAGLEHAHAQGIVHRDVKPSNLLLDAGGRVKISDFGIAKISNETSELTVTGTVMGSPHYMAPEQIRGEELDGRSDLFSLGVVLYEAVSGRRPFAGETLTTLVYQILSTEAPELPPLAPGLDPRLPRLLARLMAKDREERLPDAATAGAEIAALEAELPAAVLEAPALETTGPADPTRPLPPSGERPAAPPPPPPSAASPSPPNPPSAPVGATAPVPPPPPPTAAPGASPGAGGARSGAGDGSYAVPSFAGRRRRTLLIAALVVLMLAGALAAALLLRGGGDGTAVPDGAEPGQVAEGTEPAPPPAAGWDAGDRPGGGAAEAGGGVEAGGDPVAGEDLETDAAGEPAVGAETGGGQTGGAETGGADTGGAGVAGSRAGPAPSRPAPSPPPASGDTAAEPGPRPEDGPVPDPAATDPPARRTVPPPAAEPDDPPPPVQDSLPTGLRLHFDVMPPDAFVLVDGTVIGRAVEFASRGGRIHTLPGAGTYRVTLRRDGMEDVHLAVDADPARGGPTPVRARMTRLAAAETPLHELETYRVRQGVVLRVDPPTTRVLVDGEPRGFAKRYSGGGGPFRRGQILELPLGVHRVTLMAPGRRRVDFAVDVTAGATRDRTRIELTLPPLPPGVEE